MVSYEKKARRMMNRFFGSMRTKRWFLIPRNEREANHQLSITRHLGISFDDLLPCLAQAKILQKHGQAYRTKPDSIEKLNSEFKNLNVQHEKGRFILDGEHLLGLFVYRGERPKKTVAEVLAEIEEESDSNDDKDNQLPALKTLQPVAKLHH